MKIKYKRGNLLEADEIHLVHGCNAQGVMGSGVARAIRDWYPKAYQDYRSVYQEGKLLLGNIISSAQDDGRVIHNAVTQEFYGRDSRTYVSYWAIAETFSKLESYNLGHIALPKIGAGLGGGDWSVIEAIIENCLVRTEATVYEL